MRRRSALAKGQAALRNPTIFAAPLPARDIFASRAAALTPRVAVAKRFRRDRDLASPVRFPPWVPRAVLCLWSPLSGTRATRLLRHSQGRLQAESCKLQPSPGPDLSFARAVGRATGIWGASCTMFLPPQTDRFPFTVGPSGNTTAGINPSMGNSSHFAHQGFWCHASRAQKQSVCFAGVADFCTRPDEPAGRHAVPIPASPGAMAEGASHVATVIAQGPRIQYGGSGHGAQ